MARPFIAWDTTRPGFGRADYAAADRVCRTTTGPKNAQRHVWSAVERYMRLLQDGYRVSGGVGWVAPIGVPTPLWGTTNPIDIARPTLPSPWTSNTAGWYFVQSGGTNSGNGYPGSPRGTLPTPAAGEKVVLNGTWSGGPTISWAGTAANPIWLMGYNPASRPTFSNPWNITSSYVVYDNLASSYTNQDGIGVGGSYNLVRDSTLSNPYDSANGSGFYLGGSNVILYNITIPQMGNWQYTGSSDIDRHGIKVGAGSDMWLVDSTIYHCHGDSIQVGDQTNAASAINRVYVGRNTFYENYQTGGWNKNVTDLIFSQNTAYNMLTSSAYGACSALGGQYDAKYVWFIANKCYDSGTGVHIAGSGNGGGGPWYVIGNLLYNINYPGTPGSPEYDAGAIGCRNVGTFTAIFNTLYNCDYFFTAAPGPSPYRVYNNILATLASGGTAFATGSVSVTHDYNCFSSSAFDPGSEANRRVGDPLFVAAGTDFSLQSGSPARDVANPTEEAAFAAFQTRYSLDIRKDILGGTRPFGTRWDIGAYEYGATTGTPPTGTPGLSVR